jgi:hypothetical protein
MFVQERFTLFIAVHWFNKAEPIIVFFKTRIRLHGRRWYESTDGRGTPTRISVVDGVGNWPSRQRPEQVVECHAGAIAKSGYARFKKYCVYLQGRLGKGRELETEASTL